MRLSFLFLLMFSGISAALAQGRVEVEADPIAYIFKGYSFHLGYQTGHWRFNAGTFAITQPDFLHLMTATPSVTEDLESRQITCSGKVRACL